MKQLKNFTLTIAALAILTGLSVIAFQYALLIGTSIVDKKT